MEWERIIAVFIGFLFSLVTFLSHLSPSYLLPILEPVRHHFLNPLSINAYSWRMFAGSAETISISRVSAKNAEGKVIEITGAQTFGMSALPSSTDSFYNSLTVGAPIEIRAGYLCFFCSTPSVSEVYFEVANKQFYELRDNPNDPFRFQTLVGVRCPCKK